MPDPLPLKVYILGAGCSACGEYPLAKNIPSEMEKFAQTLGLEAPNLKRCTLDTLRLMREHGVDTLDQLVGVGDIEKVKINEAKIATNVLFLSLENQAVQKAYRHYAAFFDELFMYGDSPSLEKRVEATPCRVLTYNYDQLFERTFIEWAKRNNFATSASEAHKILSTSETHKILNSGLGDSTKMEFRDNCFAFVKLHGGVGQYHRDSDSLIRYPNRSDFFKDIPAFTDANYHHMPTRPRDRPMLVFPTEKLDAQEGNSFGDYLAKVKKEAMTFLAQADEIHIVGYSIQSIDFFEFKQFINAAKSCKLIVVQNLESERMRLERILNNLRAEVKAGWKIEYRAEGF